MDQLKSPLKRYNPSQTNLEIGWLGADLEKGPQPAFFYFALSLESTLLQEPFNTPVYFKPDNTRFFSVSLPFHQWGQNEERTLDHWVEEEKKSPFIETFFDQLAQTIILLKPFCTKIHLLGLSRGAWIAMHLSHKLKAKNLLTDSLVLFAPLCDWDLICGKNNPLFPSCLELDFSNKPLWISISCSDTRVDTEKVVSLFKRQQLYDPKGLREHRLILYPAIGHKGHGTPALIFEEGMRWLLSRF